MFSDFIVFVDESGDHGLTTLDATYPVFVLSFCIFRKSDYLTMVLPRLTELKFRNFGHDEIIFHEADIRKKSGAFSKLGKEEREEFMAELTIIIEEIPFTLVAVVIRKDHLKSQYLMPDNPYNLAMCYGLERVYQFLVHENQHAHITHVLFECRGKKEDAELELEFRRVRDGANYHNLKLPFDIVFVDKKSNSPGLQLADMTARPVGLRILRPEQPNRAFDAFEKKFYTDTRYPGKPTKWGFGLKVFP